MKVESGLFLQKAHEFLGKADELLNRNRWPDEAGRAAYFAGFHAAQALLFEKLGRSPKTHSGVPTRFADLARNEPAIDLELRAFLGQTYNLKAIADYESGPDAKVTDKQAAQAIVTAQRFVAAIEALLRS